MPILLDFESRSRCDLKKHGGRLYWEHPSTEVLCCVLYDTATHDVKLWLPGDPCPVGPNDILGAHNMMGFDRFACARLGWRAVDAEYIDTAELARRAGLPGALDVLGTRWLGLPKDKVASRFTISLSQCRRPTAKHAHLAPGGEVITAEEWRDLSAEEKREQGYQCEITAEDLQRVVAYCASDVEILAHGWPMLEPWLDIEQEVSAAERAVNERGIGFDSALARRLLKEDAANAQRVCVEVAEELEKLLGSEGFTFDWTSETVRTIANSPERFCTWTGAPNAQKETVAALDHPLARARQALASIARGKLEAGLNLVSDDGRLRDMHRYYGAHTGRWSGRGMQLQNMPRPADRFEDWGDGEICHAADDVLAGAIVDAPGIDLLLRACLVAKPGHTFITCDFAGVEARALAWCAGDQRALDVFASGKDPYKVMASTIFGVPYDSIGKDERRSVGKIAELACGYGMGATKFEMTAAKAGQDLSAIGVSAKAVIKAWREQHSPIVHFWHDVEDAFRDAVNGIDGQVDRFKFVSGDDGQDVAIFLPSGRPIVYNNATTLRQEQFGRMRDCLVFQGTKTGLEFTYGGKLVENIIQAMCRDLMAEAMVRCEKAGQDVVLHVHDELVCEVPESGAAVGLGVLERNMLTLSPWAEGFPIGVAGHIGRRYRK
jgi:DNA polymerase